MSDFEVTGGFEIQCCGHNMMTREQIRNLVLQFLSWFWPPLLTIYVTTTAPAPALAALPPSPRAPSDDSTDTGTNSSVSVREVREAFAHLMVASGSGPGSDTETGSSSTYGSEASPNDRFFARAVKREEDSD